MTDAPEVKPLVWKRSDLISWGETARTNIGVYRLTWEFADGPNGEDAYFSVTYNGIGLHSGWSESAAYKAAQNDYERRIHSQQEGGA